MNPEADGIHCQNPVLDYPKVIDKKNRIVNKHSKGVEFLLRKNKVEWIKGYARLKGGGRIEVQGVDGTQTLEARNIIIATGSEARMLPGLLPDPDLILTNIEILNLTAVPKSLAIIGAGAVGVEFASIFSRFGTEVSVFEMLPRVVPVEDEEISKELDRSFRKAGIRVETGAKVENVRKGGKGVQMTVTLANGKTEEVEAEKLLVAVGRKPNTENIGVENTRVELDRGFIKVNPYQQTGEPGVYAIGDVVAGTPQLAHVATMEGMVAVAHAAGKPATPIVLTANFTAYPFEERARFPSPDPDLAKIWEVSRRTARFDAHETYMDTPYYEQLQYLGDTRIQALISYAVAGDDRLARQAIEAFDHSAPGERNHSQPLPQFAPPAHPHFLAVVDRIDPRLLALPARAAPNRCARRSKEPAPSSIGSPNTNNPTACSASFPGGASSIGSRRSREEFPPTTLTANPASPRSSIWAHSARLPTWNRPLAIRSWLRGTGPAQPISARASSITAGAPTRRLDCRQS